MTISPPKPRRTAGMLLHPTSLPGPHGMGDIGRTARRFIDWLASSGLSIWQVLPLNPTSNNSPYMCWSAFAGNPLLVDLAGLAEIGLLEPGDLDHPPPAGTHVDFDAVTAFTIGGMAGFSWQPCRSCGDTAPGQRVEVSVTIADW